MRLNESIGLYETEIPGHPESTRVRYKIVVYDYAENRIEKDGAGNYYPYTVIPELSAILTLTTLFATTTSTLILTRINKKNKLKPTNHTQR